MYVARKKIKEDRTRRNEAAEMQASDSESREMEQREDDIGDFEMV